MGCGASNVCSGYSLDPRKTSKWQGLGKKIISSPDENSDDKNSNKHQILDSTDSGILDSTNSGIHGEKKHGSKAKTDVAKDTITYNALFAPAACNKLTKLSNPNEVLKSEAATAAAPETSQRTIPDGCEVEEVTEILLKHETILKKEFMDKKDAMIRASKDVNHALSADLVPASLSENNVFESERKLSADKQDNLEDATQDDVCDDTACEKMLKSKSNSSHHSIQVSIHSIPVISMMSNDSNDLSKEKSSSELFKENMKDVVMQNGISCLIESVIATAIMNQAEEKLYDVHSSVQNNQGHVPDAVEEARNVNEITDEISDQIELNKLLSTECMPKNGSEILILSSVKTPSNSSVVASNDMSKSKSNTDEQTHDCPNSSSYMSLSNKDDSSQCFKDDMIGSERNNPNTSNNSHMEENNLDNLSKTKANAGMGSEVDDYVTWDSEHSLNRSVSSSSLIKAAIDQVKLEQFEKSITNKEAENSIKNEEVDETKGFNSSISHTVEEENSAPLVSHSNSVNALVESDITEVLIDKSGEKVDSIIAMEKIPSGAQVSNTDVIIESSDATCELASISSENVCHIETESSQTDKKDVILDCNDQRELQDTENALEIGVVEVSIPETVSPANSSVDSVNNIDKLQHSEASSILVKSEKSANDILNERALVQLLSEKDILPNDASIDDKFDPLLEKRSHSPPCENLSNDIILASAFVQKRPSGESLLAKGASSHKCDSEEGLVLDIHSSEKGAINTTPDESLVITPIDADMHTHSDNGELAAEAKEVSEELVPSSDSKERISKIDAKNRFSEIDCDDNVQKEVNTPDNIVMSSPNRHVESIDRKTVDSGYDMTDSCKDLANDVDETISPQLVSDLGRISDLDNETSACIEKQCSKVNSQISCDGMTTPKSVDEKDSATSSVIDFHAKEIVDITLNKILVETNEGEQS